MSRHIVLCLILILAMFSANAQRTYSTKNLERLSSEELFLYYQKSLNLQDKGQYVAFIGVPMALVGIVAGSLAGGGDSDFLVATSATLMAVGSAASIIGFTLFMAGSTRVDRINKVRRTYAMQLELLPGGLYCTQTHNYTPGITLRLKF
ncbi:hypothetical protein SLH46_11280 [Draconibacterium sp. IB214405]|uniref:hypothetical protein n=1 Tax=Draconibacterium sp. IB214405 TaxID=3097352 RepID=UPI002A0E98B2|nr:hypothetical protein [Draconibacterium sp. IB214405]MDX8339769.1 hypothetical protein [Draconibacterium sp. IB214405]